jgi:alkylation response protein AidB-like acyl-CoA dehydrogenase
MDFDFSDEQKQLKDAARRLLEKESTPQRVRAVLESAEGYDKALWKSLVELGVTGAAIPEQYGGLGLGYLELCVVAEELGRTLAPVPFSSTVYLFAELIKAAGSEAQKSKYLPKVAAGELIGTLAYTEGAGEMAPKRVKALVSGGRLTGSKSLVLDGGIADVAVVVARDEAAQSGERVSLFLVQLKDATVKKTPLKTVDGSRKYLRLDFNGTAAEPLGRSGDGASVLRDVFDRAAVLTAFEQVGGADRALEMARDYALERMAFGRPIGSFQAIKHMLADMYVSATLARSNAFYGAWALSTGAAELPVAAATARVSATQAFQHCSTNNIQVHGGMGFTWQFDCHLYYRRSNMLAVALGTQSKWEAELIDRMRKRNVAAA